MKKIKENVTAYNKELENIRLDMLELRIKMPLPSPNVSDMLEQETLCVKTVLADSSPEVRDFQQQTQGHRAVNGT